MNKLKLVLFVICAAIATYCAMVAFETADAVEFVVGTVLAVIFGLSAALAYLD